MHKVFSRAIVLDAHPRTLISVSVLVQHDDGALLAAAVNCVTLALVDAGVPLCGLFVAVSLGLEHRGDAIVASADGGVAMAGSQMDLLSVEENRLAVVATLAYLGSGASPVLWHQHGNVAIPPPLCSAVALDARLAADAVLAFLRLAVSQRVERARARLPSSDEAATATQLAV